MDTEAGKSIEPGMPGNPVRLTDPKMMRALAHPARIAIWSHIGLRGSVTATECAEVAGLSPSACSYHLRTLARYGERHSNAKVRSAMAAVSLAPRSAKFNF